MLPRSESLPIDSPIGASPSSSSPSSSSATRSLRPARSDPPSPSAASSSTPSQRRAADGGKGGRRSLCAGRAARPPRLLPAPSSPACLEARQAPERSSGGSGSGSGGAMRAARRSDAGFFALATQSRVCLEERYGAGFGTARGVYTYTHHICAHPHGQAAERARRRCGVLTPAARRTAARRLSLAQREHRKLALSLRL